MNNKWHLLLNKLEISGLIQEENPWNREALEEFEKQNQFILPEEYKFFLQVFGTGCLGNTIIIMFPTVKLLPVVVLTLLLNYGI